MVARSRLFQTGDKDKGRVERKGLVEDPFIETDDLRDKAAHPVFRQTQRNYACVA